MFEENLAQLLAGAISGRMNVTLDIQATSFVGNKAEVGGAIVSQQEVHLSIANCTFKDNSAQFKAGAVFKIKNVTPSM